jgi:hypothetical protein
MKKMLFCVLAGLMLAGPAIAWLEPGQTALDPITARYYTTLYSNTILPITANTGSIGSSGNAFNAVWADSINSGIFRATNDSVTFWAQGTGLAVNQYLRLYFGDNPGIGLVDSTAAAQHPYGSMRASRTSGANDITWTFNRRIVAGVAQCSTATFPTSIGVGTGGTVITGIYTGNATGWTLENTIDTNVVSGVTATSRSSVQMKAATATITAPLCCRTVVDTLFISCAAADTAAVRAGSVDYLIFK